MLHVSKNRDMGHIHFDLYTTLTMGGMPTQRLTNRYVS
jgi:hypothetical protein